MNILIGDDHLLFREGLRRLLEQVHPQATFHEVSTFDELFAMCQGDVVFNLILTDLRMPGWDGFEGLDTIRGRQPDASIVVVSASENLADVRAALDHGAVGYIPKTSSARIMTSALELISSGGVYVPPAALRSSSDSHAVETVSGDNDGHHGHHHGLPASANIQGALTQRQLDVLAGLRAGKSNKQIAYELGLSEGTVKIHVTAIFKSLRVRNRTQAAMAYPLVVGANGN